MSKQEAILDHFLLTKSVTTDSRKVKAGDIYFALRGDSFNGNLFANAALEAGATLAVVDEPSPGFEEQKILVPDALHSLQQLALAYRRRFAIPFFALTGSNGKTTTKELLKLVLEKKYITHATKGNLNNHIGVPLTILATPANAEFAIIEMGANHQKEIASYCQFTEPTAGLITNIGKAHLEGFGGFEGVIKGKKELFDYISTHGGTIFINQDDAAIAQFVGYFEGPHYGLNCDQFSLKITNENGPLSAEWKTKNASFELRTNLTGAYNLSNIAAAISVGLFYGVSESQIAKAIETYEPDNNRSQMVSTGSNTLIMDAYNANPTSMENALKNLSRQHGKDVFLIIGDMRELGEEAPQEHRKILQLAQDLQLTGIVVGPLFGAWSKEFAFQFFDDNEAAKSWLRENPLKGKHILIKGSRGMKLEVLREAL
jgi:UDP-N-acetylmuramoyl-tripeptide--D-alanyl-D-alanine ligase